MVYDKIGLGRAIYTNGVDIDKTSTFTARAYEDSVDGYVEISVDGSGIISVPTTVSVSQGDTVMVTKVNNQSTVTGVVGGGDAMVDDIDAAAAAAALAAAEGIAAAQAAADAQAEIDGVKEYFYSDSKGAHVTSTPTSPSDHMVTVDSDGMHIIKDGSTTAEFQESEMNLFGDTISMSAYNEYLGKITANKSLSISASDGDLSVNAIDGNMSFTCGSEVAFYSQNFVAKKAIKKIFIAEKTVSTMSNGTFDTVTIDISSRECKSNPICIPQSDGWIMTQAPDSISDSSIKAKVANISGESHSGKARYLCIELYEMDAPN